MHELSVTQNILDIALRYAEKLEADQITDIYLVIGQLSSIVDDSIQFYWELIAKETIAEHAQLHFQRRSAEFRCNHCHQTYAMTADLKCPYCDSSDVQIIVGDEFYLEAIEVEGV